MSYGGLPKDYKMSTVDSDKEDTSKCQQKQLELFEKMFEDYETSDNWDDFFGVDTGGEDKTVECPVTKKAQDILDGAKKPYKCKHKWKKVPLVYTVATVCELCDERKDEK